jgi:hypothetical protein
VRTPFSLADADRANDEWGANCGPGALAAIIGLTLDEVRQHMGDFESKRYTNPTLMVAALKSVGARYVVEYGQPIGGYKFPNFGLARIQWEGPWTSPGVPIRVRYRQTHWVGAKTVNGSVGIFDINCLSLTTGGSGWTTLEAWRDIVVPFILRECVPRADGKWHITHPIEVAPVKAEQVA